MQKIEKPVKLNSLGAHVRSQFPNISPNYGVLLYFMTLTVFLTFTLPVRAGVVS